MANSCINKAEKQCPLYKVLSQFTMDFLVLIPSHFICPKANIAKLLGKKLVVTRHNFQHLSTLMYVEY